MRNHNGPNGLWRAKRLGYVSRILLAVLVLGGGAYAHLLVVLFSSQTSFIFPGAETQGHADIAAPEGAELVTLTVPTGDRIAALFGPALSADGAPRPDAQAQPALLFFYGNGDCIQKALPMFEGFRKLGLNVLIPEYIGYGMSTGVPSEIGCYATAETAYAYLCTRPGVDPARIVIAGWSLGSAVAVDLALHHSPAGLALFSAFTSMVEMGSLSYPFVPASLLIQHRFESITKLGQIRCPVFLAHGTDDRFVPVEMARRLAAVAQRPISPLLVDRAGHADLFVTGGQPLLDALGGFVDSVAPRMGAAPSTADAEAAAARAV